MREQKLLGLGKLDLYYIILFYYVFNLVSIEIREKMLLVTKHDKRCTFPVLSISYLTYFV